jgi:hypothetical protein
VSTGEQRVDLISLEPPWNVIRDGSAAGLEIKSTNKIRMTATTKAIPTTTKIPSGGGSSSGVIPISCDSYRRYRYSCRHDRYYHNYRQAGTFFEHPMITAVLDWQRPPGSSVAPPYSLNKVVWVGPAQCGKSCLFQRFGDNNFRFNGHFHPSSPSSKIALFELCSTRYVMTWYTDEYVPTIGVEFQHKLVHHLGSVIRIQCRSIDPFFLMLNEL